MLRCLIAGLELIVEEGKGSTESWMDSKGNSTDGACCKQKKSEQHLKRVIHILRDVEDAMGISMGALVKTLLKALIGHCKGTFKAPLRHFLYFFLGSLKALSLP